LVTLDLRSPDTCPIPAKIASLKHGATKNDKKRKKEVIQQVEAMEKEMRDRHEEELKAAESGMASPQLGPATASRTVDSDGDKTSSVAGSQPPKPSKAMMRRVIAVGNYPSSTNT